MGWAPFPTGFGSIPVDYATALRLSRLDRPLSDCDASLAISAAGHIVEGVLSASNKAGAGFTRQLANLLGEYPAEVVEAVSGYPHPSAKSVQRTVEYDLKLSMVESALKEERTRIVGVTQKARLALAMHAAAALPDAERWASFDDEWRAAIGGRDGDRALAAVRSAVEGQGDG